MGICKYPQYGGGRGWKYLREFAQWCYPGLRLHGEVQSVLPGPASKISGLADAIHFRGRLHGLPRGELVSSLVIMRLQEKKNLTFRGAQTSQTICSLGERIVPQKFALQVNATG